MGLIKCPNCNEIIEDNVYVCPKCGFIFNDGSNDKNEEWADYLINKENRKKIIFAVLLFVGLIGAIVFFSLVFATSKDVIYPDGTAHKESNGWFIFFSIFSVGVMSFGLMETWIYAHYKVMVETFDGYSIAVRKTFAQVFVYVDNKLVEQKTKNYPSDTFKVSLPNNKKVSIILNTNVCTFELLDE